MDIIGDAGPGAFRAGGRDRGADPECDGLLVIMTPQGMTNPTLIAEKLQRFAKLDQKPILTSWMGGEEAAQGEAVLNRAGIPTFPFPDTAVRAFQYMWKLQLQPARLVRDSRADQLRRHPSASGERE